MPKGTDHSASPLVKLLFVGHSGAGKTGALTPLVKAGYKIRIIDLDAGLDALINHVKAECPEKLDTIEYVSYRDQMKMTSTGPKVKGAPKAYVDALSALEVWPEDNSDPAEWGPKHILVIDSLTNVGRAAFQWARAMNITSKDPRQWYKTAQDLLEDLIANLTSDAFNTNVIVISHVDIGENGDGIKKHFASSIGKALGPKLPRFFNTMVLSETKGQGTTLKRMIKTVPTAMLDLKTPGPVGIEAEYPIETGLLSIFQKLQAQK